MTVFSGQSPRRPSANSQRPLAFSGSSAIDSGIVTWTWRMFAWPGACVTLASTPGCLPSTVSLAPVSLTVVLGANASASQPVAWNGALGAAVAAEIDVSVLVIFSAPHDV